MSKISAIQQNGGKDLSKQYEKLKREYEELKSQFQAGNSTPIRGSSGQIQGSVAVGRDDTEQKQAEQALESLAKFPDENPYPVLRFSAEGEILYANSASQVLLQYWETTGANPQRAQIVERVKESLEKKSIVQSEVTIGGVSFSLTIIPIIEHQYVNVYAADITERMHAEMELQATNRRTIEILGSISDAFYSLDQEFRFTYVNRKAASLWGKQPEELVGKNIWEVFPSGKQTESYQKMQQVYCDKEPIRYESFSAYLNQWVDIHIYPTEQGISVYFRDITERKKAEQALQESEQRYRKLFESLQEGMFLAEVITNEQGIPVDWRYLDVNLETQHYMGMTYEQFIGHRYSEVVPHPDPAWIALLGRVALTGQPAIQEMFSPARQRWLQVSVQSPRPGQAIVLFIDITERKRAEEALRESELFYRQSLESIPGMVFTTRPDGYCDYQSQQWVDYTSVPMSQHIGDGWNNLLHPEDQPRALAAWRDAVEGRAPYNLEYRVRRSDGQYEWFKVIGRPIRDAAGKIVRWFGVATNINELIKTEEALSQSEEHFRQLADAMPQLVWTARPDGTIDYVNNRYLEYDEVYPGEIGNSEWTFYIHPDDQEQTVAAWQQALVDGDVFQTEQRLRIKNGTYRWHLSRGVPVCDENGQVVKWYGTSTDIHDLKQVEDGLRISEQRLRKLVDANIIGILYRSKDGRVLEANDAYLDITGYSRQELEEGLINTFEIIPEEFHQIDNEAMNEAREKGSCQPYEKEYIHKDGKRIPVLIGFAQLDPSEQALVGFVLDLSQLKHTEAALQDYANRLEQSNKELEHFAYIASHDLQEPLRKIKMFGERVSIRIGEQIDDETKDFLDRMQDASRRMEMMIDDLLQLSRVNTRGCPFVLVDLMKVAQEVVSDLGYRIQESGGRVVVEELPDIHADPIQIHQLLQNLIGNALKFHKPGTAPQVKVYARTNGKAESPETVKLYVSDNGVGFNEEYAERIFQPFERLVGRSEYEGSGIGLAICKKIVERHGGTITARSKRGEGSTFSITLPCKNNESRKQRRI